MSRFAAGLAGLLLASVAMGATPAQDKAAPRISAREPLSYRTMGLYGGWNPYFWDGPFDFLVVQGAMVTGDAPADRKRLDEWNAGLLRARAANKRVIADLYRVGDDAEDYYRAIERFLARVPVDELYAVTLGEENIFWKGQHEVLADLYRRIKKKYPTLPVYQWYSNTGRATDVPGFVWPWLPSDGWVVDEYWADSSDFQRLVRRHRMLAKPLIQLVWATPGIPRIPFHRSIFEGQLRVAQEYDVPCGFFCMQENPKRAWAWEEGAEAATKEVLAMAIEARKAARQSPQIDRSQWDEGCPLKTVLVRQPSGDFLYRESFDLRMKAAGEKMPDADFMDRTLIRGLRQIQWMAEPSRLVVRPSGQEPIDVCLLNYWTTPQGQSCRFSAVAKLDVPPGAAAEVALEASLNGYDWIARTATPEDGQWKLDMPAAHGQLYTRLRIAGAAGKGAMPPVAIDWIEVRGHR